MENYEAKILLLDYQFPISSGILWKNWKKLISLISRCTKLGLRSNAALPVLELIQVCRFSIVALMKSKYYVYLSFLVNTRNQKRNQLLCERLLQYFQLGRIFVLYNSCVSSGFDRTALDLHHFTHYMSSLSLICSIPKFSVLLTIKFQQRHPSLLITSFLNEWKLQFTTSCLSNCCGSTFYFLCNPYSKISHSWALASFTTN
jgi:hypothetical protein